MSSEKLSLNSPFQRALTETPLIDPGAIDAAVAAMQTFDTLSAEHPLFKRMRESLKPQMTVENGVAIIPIHGVLMRKPDLVELLYFGAEDTLAIDELISQAGNNPDISAIVLDIDSPGGYSIGIAEVGRTIQLANRKKPVVAFSGGLMASAAYWIGSQAREVYASRSARVGSIGVYATYADYSARLAAFGIKVEVFTNKEGTYKAAGVHGTALTDEQRELIQSQVQEDFDEFKSAVLNNRPDIRFEAMRGQTFSGRKAKGQGLIDDTGTLNFAIAKARRAAREGAKTV